MAGSTQACGPGGCEPNCKSKSGGSLTCPELLACMDVMVNRNKKDFGNKGTHGLKHRFKEQMNGMCRPGTKGWDTHDDQIRGLQKKLGRYSKTYRDKGCGNPPGEVSDWANKTPPKKDDWKGDWNSPSPPHCDPVPVKVPDTVPAPSKQDTKSTLNKLGGALLLGVGLLAVAAAATVSAPVTATAAVAVLAAGAALNASSGGSARSPGNQA